MRIIGITGTLGAGKGTIVDYLVKNHGFTHLSVRGYLTDIINERRMPLNRDSMVAVGNELRSNNSPSYIAEQLYKKALDSGKDCIIESLRTPGEVKALQEEGNFNLFAVDADPKVRYNRVVIRGSATDKVSLEEFMANEAREMESDDPNKQNLQACIDMADYIIKNDSTRYILNQKIEDILDELN